MERLTIQLRPGAGLLCIQPDVGFVTCGSYRIDSEENRGRGLSPAAQKLIPVSGASASDEQMTAQQVAPFTITDKKGLKGCFIEIKAPIRRPFITYDTIMTLKTLPSSIPGWV